MSEVPVAEADVAEVELAEVTGTLGRAEREAEPDGAGPTGAPRGAHARVGEPVTDQPRGAHVKKGDPFLSVEGRALHARTTEPLAPPDPGAPTPDASPPVGTAPPVGTTPPVDPAPRLTPAPPQPSAAAASAVEGSPAARFPRRAVRTPQSPSHKGRRAGTRHRWRVATAAGAAGALAVGLGAGSAFGYLDGHGSGSGSAQVTTGGPVTMAVTATTGGEADLLPGRTGAASFTVRNTTDSPATFDQVAPGATVVSDNTDLCANGDVAIAQTLPYTLPAPVTVSPGGTSATQSIPNLVELAATAPSSCQGVSFTVTLTLTGRSS